MINLKSTISTLLIIGQLSYADCPKDVQIIKQGQTANCDGFIFSNNAEKQAEQYREDSIFYKSYSDKLNEKIKLEAAENDILQKRLNLYLNESQRLAEEVSKRDNNEGLYRFIYFALGVVATGLVVRNVRP